MATDQTRSIEQDLNDSLEELRLALQHAHDATASLQRIVPRVAQIGTLFDDISAVISTGRQQLGISDSSGASYGRPTLVVPGGREPTPDMRQPDDPWASLAKTWGDDNGATAPLSSNEGPSTASATATVALTCFRLEFESKPGPLDLRSVDDAVAEHPAVRDVALIDYDGRKATLKVWIEQGTDPSEIQNSLIEKASALFGPDNEVTVTAREEAAA